MKISFLIENFLVLSQNFVFKQITSLIADGHEVDVFSDNIHDTSLFQQEVVKYHLMEKCHVICSPRCLFRKLSGTLALLLGFGPLSSWQSMKALNRKRAGLALSFDDL
jgi:hypothetical protein